MFAGASPEASLKEGGKTDGSVRAVPRSYGRGEVQAPRMGTRLTRLRVPHRRLYHCRHTFATWAIESGVFWGPPDENGNQLRWSRAWYD
jgi:integrase